ncbi:MAG: hypothetical protein QOG99_2143 [Frankiales bacterium]|nr:hypothetical protein [Frankiales bacterium]
MTIDSSHRTLQITAPVAAGIGLALALAIIFAGNYHVSTGENGGIGPALITAIGCLILSGILFGVVLPSSASSSPTTATTLGIVAALSIIAFWSGATPVLAAASLAATSGRTRTRAAGTAQALAVIAAAAAVIITLATSHLF